MNKFLSIALFAAAILCCSFSSSTTKNALIQQKWRIDSRDITSHDDKGTHTANIKALKNDYIEFTENGKAYCCFKGSCDTLDYTLINDSTISFGDELYSIKTLSSKEMVLYQNEEDKNGEYNRTWIRLRK